MLIQVRKKTECHAKIGVTSWKLLTFQIHSFGNFLSSKKQYEPGFVFFLEKLSFLLQNSSRNISNINFVK